MSQNDMHAFKMMQDSVKFSSGHSEIALPWKNEPPHLVNNRSHENTDYNCLRSVYREKYKQFMLTC